MSYVFEFLNGIYGVLFLGMVFVMILDGYNFNLFNGINFELL